MPWSHLIAPCYHSRTSCSSVILVSLGPSITSSQAEPWGLGVAGTHCPLSRHFEVFPLHTDTPYTIWMHDRDNPSCLCLALLFPGRHLKTTEAELECSSTQRQVGWLAEPETSVQLRAGKHDAQAHLPGAWTSHSRLHGSRWEVMRLESNGPSGIEPNVSPRKWKHKWVKRMTSYRWNGWNTVFQVQL